MVNGQIIRTKRTLKKLDARMYGPFKVTKVIPNGRAAKIQLPENWKIHPVFHVSLLEPYRGDPTRAEFPEVELADDGEGWTVEAIIAAGPDDDRPEHHKFLVKWKDFSHAENTWESFGHLFDVAPDLVQSYYQAHPHLTPDPRMGRRRRR